MLLINLHNTPLLAVSFEILHLFGLPTLPDLVMVYLYYKMDF